MDPLASTATSLTSLLIPGLDTGAAPTAPVVSLGTTTTVLDRLLDPSVAAATVLEFFLFLLKKEVCPGDTNCCILDFVTRAHWQLFLLFTRIVSLATSSPLPFCL